ncbi:MAG: acyl carrier protein [Clostridia bacterium]|nr:acyl carrier protein [Clostridia bacterium]
MTFDKVKTLISQQLKVPADKVTLDARLVEDLGADSANVMVLIMEVEDQFGIMVEDDAIMTLKTVQDVVGYIDSKM